MAHNLFAGTGAQKIIPLETGPGPTVIDEKQKK